MITDCFIMKNRMVAQVKADNDVVLKFFMPGDLILIDEEKTLTLVHVNKPFEKSEQSTECDDNVLVSLQTYQEFYEGIFRPVAFYSVNDLLNGLVKTYPNGETDKIRLPNGKNIYMYKYRIIDFRDYAEANIEKLKHMAKNPSLNLETIGKEFEWILKVNEYENKYCIIGLSGIYIMIDEYGRCSFSLYVRDDILEIDAGDEGIIDAFDRYSDCLFK